MKATDTLMCCPLPPEGSPSTANALNNERRPPCPSAPCPSSPSTAPNFSTMSVGCCEGPGGASEEGASEKGAGEGDTASTPHAEIRPRSRRRTRRGRCTCGPGSREEDEEPLAAPSQEQERLLVPSPTSLSDLPGVVRRVDYLFFAGVAWSLARPRAPLTAPRGACFFSFPPPTPRRRFRRRVVNPGSSFASVAGGPSVPSATESTASAISTKGGACFFLPLSYLARRRRCVAV